MSRYLLLHEEDLRQLGSVTVLACEREQTQGLTAYPGEARLAREDGQRLCHGGGLVGGQLGGQQGMPFTHVGFRAAPRPRRFAAHRVADELVAQPCQAGHRGDRLQRLLVGDASDTTERSEALMLVMDQINTRWGRGTLKPLVTGLDQRWQMRRNQLSPAWTTDWNALPVALAR